MANFGKRDEALNASLDPLRSYQVLGGEGPRQTICEGPEIFTILILLYHKDQMANGNKLTR